MVNKENKIWEIMMESYNNYSIKSIKNKDWGILNSQNLGWTTFSTKNAIFSVAQKATYGCFSFPATYMLYNFYKIFI